MRYLITFTDGKSPFLTDYYTSDNNFVIGNNMIVYDLYKNAYTSDGKIWIEIEVDHL